MTTYFISIHALLAESDRADNVKRNKKIKFLSTLSLRRATFRYTVSFSAGRISIHALLAESDCPLFFSCWLLAYFYPRSPCGERPVSVGLLMFNLYFYPRSPCGERRFRTTFHLHCFINFYPRSPCGERLCVRCFGRFGPADFYPRSPCGERRVTVLGIQHRVGISIHALLAESDSVCSSSVCTSSTISIHALLAESDHDWPPVRDIIQWISIHALLAESDNINSSVNTADQISIHALLAESDFTTTITIYIVSRFLSTLSLRRATVVDNVVFVPGQFLSTLSLRRATNVSRDFAA